MVQIISPEQITKDSCRQHQLKTPDPLQGSVIGPFVFIIYLNYVLKTLETDCYCRPLAYADDTTLLFEVSRSPQSSETRAIERNIERSTEVFNQYGLVVNSGKTRIVLFHNPQ